MLDCEDPLYEQDEAHGEQREIPKSFIRELLRVNAPLLTTLCDMDAGLIHVSMSEYNEFSYKFMTAWRLFQSLKAEKIKAERAKGAK